MVPQCTQCIYYKPGMYKSTGMCRMYPVYRGIRVVNEFANEVRKDPKKCGPEGKYFRDKNPIMFDLDEE